jgi:hypothetical protein
VTLGGRPATQPAGTRPARVLVFGALAACTEFRVGARQPEVTPGVRLEERFVQAALPALDLLLVVDDTPSMAAEQAALASALPRLALALADAGLAWQAGVVTTTMEGPEAGVLQGSPWILTPDTADLATALPALAQVGTAGAEPAAGLAAFSAALLPPLRDGANRGFRRAGAGLHVIVLSDGDDGSDDWLGPDPVAAAADHLAAEAATTGRRAVFSAVVGPAPAGCSGPGGQALPAARYAALVAATGGTLASICAGDLAPLADTLAVEAAEYPTRFPLQARPRPATVRVSLDGAPLDSGWAVESAPPTLVFADAPPAGAAIRVRYEVAE